MKIKLCDLLVELVCVGVDVRTQDGSRVHLKAHEVYPCAVSLRYGISYQSEYVKDGVRFIKIIPHHWGKKHVKSIKYNDDMSNVEIIIY